MHYLNIKLPEDKKALFTHIRKNVYKYMQKDKKYYLLKSTKDKSYYKYFNYGGQFVSNPLKKELKKLSSSKRRRIIRDWINDKNWDNTIKTFRFDRSFDREIY